MKRTQLWIIASMLLVTSLPIVSRAQLPNKEKHRPQLHFSPKAHWMNDPNGMVYNKGIYHLFYQYHPGSTTWGPMHWGHAISKDLISWKEQPIALYPDSLGAIFSGSAVVDSFNTAGFGEGALVAIFTHHNKKIEDARTGLHQYQSLAYSLDEGKTWTKYKGNPVLPNPNIWDFRDPKVHWNESAQKWIMTLATKDRITFYSSPNLKNWTKESEFGEKIGAHGGVWECPDLFPLELNGKMHWVLLVSINPGAPNGGSGTQYFIGDFDGHQFIPETTETRWLDYGTDNYAGITWSNTGNRKIFIGWMNNWTYANEVPTGAWRGATTIARELRLIQENGKIAITSLPVPELNKYNGKSTVLKNLTVKNTKKLKLPLTSGAYKLQFTLDEPKDFEVVLSNDIGEQVVLGYSKQNNRYFIDRTKSGQVHFNKEFAQVHYAPRMETGKDMYLTILVDAASIEFFADRGETVMTDVFFPNQPFNGILMKSESSLLIHEVSYTPFKIIF